MATTNLTSGQNLTDQSSYSTASISPAANALLMVAVHNQSPATLPTLSGLGLTWTQRATIVYSTICRLTYFTAVTGASPGSGQITIAYGGTSQANCQWTVDQATSVDTAAPVVQTVTTNNLSALGTSITATLAAFGSSNNRPHGAACCWNDNATISPESGWTELAEPGPHTDDYWGNLQSMWRDSSADLTPTWGYSASVYRGAIAIEIKAASTGYTLTADSGSFTVTGTAASLNYGRLLTAESGAYSVSGTAANLLYGRLLTAESGSHAVTGTDASLFYGRLLSADSGAYSFTGTDASLLYARIMVADSGSYTITGTDASLYKGITLTAESGSFAVTGTDASLLATRLITAESGAYTVAGTDASLYRSITITAESGVYSFNGTDASLLYGRLLTAESGSFAITGTDADLIYTSLNPTLTAEPGSFVITGTDANLIYRPLTQESTGGWERFLFSQKKHLAKRKDEEAHRQEQIEEGRRQIEATQARLEQAETLKRQEQARTRRRGRVIRQLERQAEAERAEIEALTERVDALIILNALEREMGAIQQTAEQNELIRRRRNLMLALILDVA